MTKILSYRDLDVWQLSIQVAEDIFNLTKAFPKGHAYALKDQMQRAAISISSNIAEGHGGGTRKEYIKFLYYANRSRCEVESQLILAVKLEFAAKEPARKVMHDLFSIGRMLSILIKKLENKKSPKPNTQNPTPKS